MADNPPAEAEDAPVVPAARVDYSSAKNALGYMMNVLASFQNASLVLDALANAEQVQKELDDANDKVRQSVTNCKSEFEDLTARIERAKADAQAEAAGIVGDARDQAQHVMSAARAVRAAVEKAQAAAEAARDAALEGQAAAEAARDEAVKEHDAAVAKTADAKAKLAALLAG